MEQSAAVRCIRVRDGAIRFVAALLSPAENERWFAALRTETRWRQEEVVVFGKRRPMPRLSAWHGDEGAAYSYSGLKLHPEPWTEILLAIRRRVESVAGVGFNSVLLNYYRDGRDSMGWHSDDEPALGEAPLIGSLSLGATRRFHLRHKTLPGLRRSLDLPGGSYLEMGGATQRHWRHCVPKVTAKAGAGARINLTFRTIKTGGGVSPSPRTSARHRLVSGSTNGHRP